MSAFTLLITCPSCGAGVDLVQSVTQGTAATAVAQCSSCPSEWIVAMQLRRTAPFKAAKVAS